MRILYNIHGYKPAYQLGGPIYSVSAVAEGLVRRGHTVMVAATDSNNTERLAIDTEVWHTVEGVRVRYFRMSDSWTKAIPANYFRNSNGAFRANGLEPWLAGSAPSFDVVHSHLPFLHGNRILSAYAARARIPYFYHQRGVFDPVRLEHRALKKKVAIALWEKKVCRRASVLVALTEYERSTYRKLGLPNRVEVIPNGIDVPRLGDLDWPFANFHVGPRDQLVLFMSRLHRIKGPDLAVEAFCRVRRRFPGAKMIVAGPDDDGMTARLRSLADNTVRDNALFFCGSIEGKVKAAVLARADVFVLPTGSEGFSMAILEAAANGCAVLTTPQAHFSEIATAKAGLLCERTVSHVASGLTDLLSSPENTKTMGRAARHLVETSFTWEAVVDRFERLYTEVSQGASRGRQCA